MSNEKLGSMFNLSRLAIILALAIYALSGCSDNKKTEFIKQKQLTESSDQKYLALPDTIFPNVIDIPRLATTSGDYGCGLPSLINNAYIIDDTSFSNASGYNAFACEILNPDVNKTEKLNTVIKYALSLEKLGWIPVKSNSTTNIEYYREGLFECRNTIVISTEANQSKSEYYGTLSKQTYDVQSRAIFFKLSSKCDDMNSSLKSAYSKYQPR